MEKGNPPPYSPSAPPPPGFIMPQPQTTVINVERQQAAPQQVVVLTGGCPSCRVGVLHKSYCTCCGIFWAIVLFPIGLLCLLVCSKYRCTNCSYTK